MSYLLSVIAFTCAFMFIKTCFGVLRKNINHLFSLKDSMVLGVYFGVLSTFMQNSNFHPVDGAIIMFIGIFIIPLIYSIFKWKYFLKQRQSHFFIWEFFVILIGIFLGLAVSQILTIST